MPSHSFLQRHRKQTRRIIMPLLLTDNWLRRGRAGPGPRVGPLRRDISPGANQPGPWFRVPRPSPIGPTPAKDALGSSGVLLSLARNPTLAPFGLWPIGGGLLLACTSMPMYRLLFWLCFGWGAAVDEYDHNQPRDDMRVYVLWVGRDAVDRNRQSAGRRTCEFGTRIERRPGGNWTRP